MHLPSPACQKIIQSRATNSSIAPMLLPPQPPPLLQNQSLLPNQQIPNSFMFQSRPYYYNQQQPFNQQFNFPQRLQATSPQQLLGHQPQQQLTSYKHTYDTQSSSSGSGSGVVLNHNPFSTV